VAREGASLESLADLLGISERSIRRYNELDKNYTVSVGDKLFIEK
jgi:predicted transcriptional regulator